MLAPVSTLAQHYIRQQGQNVPINLSVTGIKCLTCGQFYGENQINRHMTIHLDPIYIKKNPVSENRVPTQLKLHEMLAGEEPSQEQQIWVKSILPAELPQTDKPKKQVMKLGQATVVSGFANNIGGLAVNHDSVQELESGLGDTAEEFWENPQQLNIRQAISIGRCKKMIQNKQIKVYMNEKSNVKNIDNTISHKKVKNQSNRDDETDVSSVDGYSLVPSKKSEGSQKGFGRLSIFPQRNRERCDIGSSRRAPVTGININTVSRYVPEDPNKIIQDDNSTVMQTNLETGRQFNNLECRTCTGFYCRECKSTIPAIFRPVPDSNGTYHFHPSTLLADSVNFYQNVYYRNISKVCKNCERPMQLGRMNEEIERQGESRQANREDRPGARSNYIQSHSPIL